MSKGVKIVPKHVDTIIYDALNGSYRVTLIEELDNEEFDISIADAKELLYACERHYFYGNVVIELGVVEEEPTEEQEKFCNALESLEVDLDGRKFCSCT